MSRNKSLLVMLIIVATIFLYNPIFSSKNKSFLEKMEEKEIKSVINKKYINYENHNIPLLVYGNKDSIVIYRDLWDNISVGDSIIKPKGSLELVIKNTNKLDKYDYDDKFGLETQ